MVWRDAGRRELLVGLGHSETNRTEVYALPGGHWERGETLAETVRRETWEEAGIPVRVVRLISVHEFYNSERDRHYVTIGFECVSESDRPRVMEPEKKVSWEWLPPSEALALPLFAPDRVLIERAMSGAEVYELERPP